MARTCHQFFDLFNAEFFGGRLPLCFLRFGTRRRGRLGEYAPTRNDVGAQFEINLNPRHFDRPLYQVLGTLLHEQIHLWQHLYGEPSKTNWHNRGFVEKARQVGIPCEGGRHAFTVSYTDPFLAVLKRERVEIGEPTALVLEAHVVQSAEKGSKLRKWACGCTNMWAAVEVDAVCRKCGSRFERRRPAQPSVRTCSSDG
jgi:SprT-like family